MSRKIKVLLTVEVPDDTSAEYMRSYMREAIEAWSGQFHPDDSLFGWFYPKQKLWLRFVKEKPDAV